MKLECRCSALGRSLERNDLDQAEVGLPVVEWRGGNVGAGRLIYEILPSDVERCPGCLHRASVYVAADRSQVTNELVTSVRRTP